MGEAAPSSSPPTPRARDASTSTVDRPASRAQPWAGKWPNLHYSTSAFAPRHYPPEIVAYANTRGADKIVDAGYSPMGLSLERIFGDLPHAPFEDEVWPRFLRQNAVRVLGLT
jgi:hypothetical protein